MDRMWESRSMSDLFADRAAGIETSTGSQWSLVVGRHDRSGVGGASSMSRLPGRWGCVERVTSSIVGDAGSDCPVTS